MRWLYNLKFEKFDYFCSSTFLIPGVGVEPTWAKTRRILSPLRLPIPPSRQNLKYK